MSIEGKKVNKHCVKYIRQKIFQGNQIDRFSRSHRVAHVLS